MYFAQVCQRIATHAHRRAHSERSVRCHTIRCWPHLLRMCRLLSYALGVQLRVARMKCTSRYDMRCCRRGGSQSYCNTRAVGARAADRIQRSGVVHLLRCMRLRSRTRTLCAPNVSSSDTSCRRLVLSFRSPACDDIDDRSSGPLLSVLCIAETLSFAEGWLVRTPESRHLSSGKRCKQGGKSVCSGSATALLADLQHPSPGHASGGAGCAARGRVASRAR